MGTHFVLPTAWEHLKASHVLTLQVVENSLHAEGYRAVDVYAIRLDGRHLINRLAERLDEEERLYQAVQVAGGTLVEKAFVAVVSDGGLV